MKALGNKIELYVPMGNVPRGEVPPREVLQAAHKVVGKMVAAFGGATVVNAVGYWQDAHGRMVVDDIKVIGSYTDWAVSSLWELARLESVSLAKTLNQDSVAAVVNGEMRFFSEFS
jgi:hypothetical protein